MNKEAQNKETQHKTTIIIFVVVAAIIIFFCFYAFTGISGTYMSQSGRYSVEFERNGNCTWFQDGAFFHGTYDKQDDGVRLEIQGDGVYLNTVFQVRIIDGNTIVVDGGSVDNEIFTKP